MGTVILAQERGYPKPVAALTWVNQPASHGFEASTAKAYNFGPH